MTAQKVDVTINRYGFSNIMSTVFGVVLVAGVAIALLVKGFLWAWPTLQWMVPLAAYLTFNVWFLYRTIRDPDEVVRTHRHYQATWLFVSNLVILIILYADMRTVVGP